jgi:hypothetical protein
MFAEHCYQWLRLRKMIAPENQGARERREFC